MRFQPEQVDKSLASFVRTPPTRIDAGNFAIQVTLTIATALNTAGQNGKAVTLRPYLNSRSGVLCTPPRNWVEIYDANMYRLASSDNEEVYGRLTLGENNTYWLHFYTLASGVEKPYTPDESIEIIFDFGYVFLFEDLPTFALMGPQVVNNDISRGLSVLQVDYVVTNKTTDFSQFPIKLPLFLNTVPSGVRRIQPGTREFYLVDCAGNLLTNRRVALYRERDYQHAAGNRDFVYEPQTARVRLTVAGEDDESLTFFVYDEASLNSCEGVSKPSLPYGLPLQLG